MFGSVTQSGVRDHAARESAGTSVTGSDLALRILPHRPRVRRRHPRVLLLPARVHGRDRDDPDRGDGRALQLQGFICVGPVRLDDPVPRLRQLGLGRRLPVAARRARSEVGSRRGRLRRLRRRARHGRRRRASGAPRSSGPASASSTRTASPAPSPAITCRWRSSARWSCSSAGWASTARRRSRRPTSASPIVIVNTILASAFGCLAHDVRDVVEVRQAGSVDDLQRPARRPRRDHRAVRVRRPVGGGDHRHDRRCARRARRGLGRAQGQGRRSGRRGRGARRERALGRARPRPVRRRHLRRRLQRCRRRREGTLLRRCRPALGAAHIRRRPGRRGARSRASCSSRS